METGNMVKILEILSMRYLELLAERLEDEAKEEYTKAVFDMRSGDVSYERILEAQKCVMKVVEKFGKLLLIGDQLTVIDSISPMIIKNKRIFIKRNENI